MNHNDEKTVRIYCDGIFDLFHYGHARALKQAKELFPRVYLIVGVCGDRVTYQMKGRTVMTTEERIESLTHCKWVDQIIEDAPWVITKDFLESNNIDFVAHDDKPYKYKDIEDVYSFVKQEGKFIPIKRTPSISTTELITRILRNYDLFIWRNIERGVSADALNLSFFKRIQIIFWLFWKNCNLK